MPAETQYAVKWGGKGGKVKRWPTFELADRHARKLYDQGHDVAIWTVTVTPLDEPPETPN